jgi:hypothetical protein
MSLGFASGPLPLVKLLHEAPDENFSRGSSGGLTAPAGDGLPAVGGKVAAEHIHHEAHLMVLLAWPEAARGGPAMAASGGDESGSGGSVLRW